ncbi:UDP-glucose/GDP-mannose dehydrogenase family protein [Dissulfurirhabdus thermomarina]|uniref:UDP-glucose 6-dehydrogenase n=1 Tax=Dissulfurirhabdus thermomarina TaxID=1765737 RepID=A0A6N9TN09_DISTH|nr:UDP-glucose/GDP-mannose dehydrogenase family protein [Dissulfurirhabdus thermomarina]NDY42682.1 UDP-glucose/GDP-mannose dehydrogenase family protein [Dissulfurirhabdus thermomarina]NMX24100.1 UDP-glucose/GDP-mannose dehydrogenase family protein [Dissulfurirhabdus thermomarina]
MKVTIFGCGYVGLVTGACFAEVGNEVLCVDVDAARVERLNAGEVPIFEPGLEDLVHRNTAAGRLAFTTDPAEAVAHGLFQMIAVGTPPDEDGSADLRHVLDVARTIGAHMDGYRVVVDKSTVPVGTADRVREAVAAELHRRGVQVEFDVVCNPEFLKEGEAVEDFMKPERIVVGADNPRTVELLKLLYAPFNRNHERMVIMDVRSAELTKYAANAMLATKISFMNEMANLAERLGADIEKVRVGIGSDSRIGYAFIYPGCGYGGSCFPKDVKALERMAAAAGYEARLLAAVEDVNRRQKEVLLRKMEAHYGDRLPGRTLALWGLSFKPGTDDIREAPSCVLIEGLLARGARVRAYDPKAMEAVRRRFGDRDGLELVPSPYEALEGADGLALVTEWKEFRSPDFDRIRELLGEPVIFDGRNVYDPDLLAAKGFAYYGIGRGRSVHRPAGAAA